ncbi:MAG: phospho-N-acetylmuramoyl-pentapeptide-transferase [bacterium]
MASFFVVKILILSTISFMATILWTPLLTYFLYKYKLGKNIRSAENAPIYAQLHQKKAGTPTMGGVLIWATTLILILFFYLISVFFPDSNLAKLNFFSRSQTLLPLGVLVATAIVGLVDDLLNIFKIGPNGGGMKIRHQLVIYTLIALVGAWWFYFKLDWDIIRIPFVGNFNIGSWIIPVFIFIIVGTAHSVNLTDGLDGLAGGTLLAGFAAYGAITFSQGKYDLASFCAVIVGALLAFLWFNINPARFFMGDTGAMSLGITLGVLAMLTNTVLILPIIGLIFVVETLSVIVQLISKKIRGKKIFLSTPLHHHLEAKGWPEGKIVMRFWVISGVTAVAGLIIFLMDKS